jgi:hypothetical protein
MLFRRRISHLSRSAVSQASATLKVSPGRRNYASDCVEYEVKTSAILGSRYYRLNNGRLMKYFRYLKKNKKNMSQVKDIGLRGRRATLESIGRLPVDATTAAGPRSSHTNGRDRTMTEATTTTRRRSTATRDAVCAWRRAWAALGSLLSVLAAPSVILSQLPRFVSVEERWSPNGCHHRRREMPGAGESYARPRPRLCHGIPTSACDSSKHAAPVPRDSGMAGARAEGATTATGPRAIVRRRRFQKTVYRYGTTNICKDKPPSFRTGPSRSRGLANPLMRYASPLRSSHGHTARRDRANAPVRGTVLLREASGRVRCLSTDDQAATARSTNTTTSGDSSDFEAGRHQRPNWMIYHFGGPRVSGTAIARRSPHAEQGDINRPPRGCSPPPDAGPTTRPMQNQEYKERPAVRRAHHAR